jgi:hypothetical protein
MIEHLWNVLSGLNAAQLLSGRITEGKHTTNLLSVP